MSKKQKPKSKPKVPASKSPLDGMKLYDPMAMRIAGGQRVAAFVRFNEAEIFFSSALMEKHGMHKIKAFDLYISGEPGKMERMIIDRQGKGLNLRGYNRVSARAGIKPLMREYKLQYLHGQRYPVKALDERYLEIELDKGWKA